MILRIHGSNGRHRMEVDWRGRFLSDGDVIILKTSRGAFEAGVWTVKSVHHEVTEDESTIKRTFGGEYEFERPMVGEQIVTIAKVKGEQ